MSVHRDGHCPIQVIIEQGSVKGFAVVDRRCDAKTIPHQPHAERQTDIGIAHVDASIHCRWLYPSDTCGERVIPGRQIGYSCVTSRLM
jgi:hypothetical protein